MYIDRILFPIETLGPGNRLVIWVKGCSKECYRCANPELWKVHNSKSVPPCEISQIIHNISNENKIDGITISGGDPFEQFDELLELLSLIRDLTDDILVYTGFEYKVFKRKINLNQKNSMERLIDVLIDGPYVDELNDTDLTLCGSSNQKIIYFNPDLELRYNEYLQRGRKIQNIYMGNKMISVGLHNRSGVYDEDK